MERFFVWSLDRIAAPNYLPRAAPRACVPPPRSSSGHPSFSGPQVLRRWPPGAAPLHRASSSTTTSR